MRHSASAFVGRENEQPAQRSIDLIRFSPCEYVAPRSPHGVVGPEVVSAPKCASPSPFPLNGCGLEGKQPAEGPPKRHENAHAPFFQDSAPRSLVRVAVSVARSGRRFGVTSLQSPHFGYSRAANQTMGLGLGGWEPKSPSHLSFRSGSRCNNGLPELASALAGCFCLLLSPGRMEVEFSLFLLSYTSSCLHA